MTNLLESVIDSGGESIIQCNIINSLPDLPDSNKRKEDVKEVYQDEPDKMNDESKEIQDDLEDEFDEQLDEAQTQMEDTIKNAKDNCKDALDNIGSDLSDLGVAAGCLVIATAEFLVRLALIPVAIIGVAPLGPAILSNLIPPMIKDLKAEGDNLSKIYDDCNSRMNKLGLNRLSEMGRSRASGLTSLVDFGPINTIISIVGGAQATAKPFILAVGSDCGGDKGKSMAEIQGGMDLSHVNEVVDRYNKHTTASNCENYSSIGIGNPSASNCTNYNPIDSSQSRDCKNCIRYYPLDIYLECKGDIIMDSTKIEGKIKESTTITNGSSNFFIDSNNVNMKTENGELSISPENVSVKSTKGDILIESPGNINLTSEKSILLSSTEDSTITTEANFNTTVGGDLVSTVSGNIEISAENGDVSVESKNVIVTTTEDTSIESKNLNIVTTEDTSIESKNVIVTTTEDTSIESKNVTITTTEDTSIESKNSNITSEENISMKSKELIVDTTNSSIKSEENILIESGKRTDINTAAEGIIELKIISEEGEEDKKSQVTLYKDNLDIDIEKVTIKEFLELYNTGEVDFLVNTEINSPEGLSINSPKPLRIISMERVDINAGKLNIHSLEEGTDITSSGSISITSSAFSINSDSQEINIAELKTNIDKLDITSSDVNITVDNGLNIQSGTQSLVAKTDTNIQTDNGSVTISARREDPGTKSDIVINSDGRYISNIAETI